MVTNKTANTQINALSVPFDFNKFKEEEELSSLFKVSKGLSKAIKYVFLLNL